MAHDRPVEVETAGRAVERGMAVVEDAAVGGRQPVPLAVRGSCKRAIGLFSHRPAVEPS